MRLIFVFLCAACVLPNALLAQSPVTLTVDTQSPGRTIPSDFLGLSFETGNLQSNGVGVAGYMFDSANTQLVTIFTNLGIKNLRIGGISVDRANGTIPQYTPTNQDIDALFRFADATGVDVIFSLRLENGDPLLDASIAGYTWTNYNQYLTGFAIGNEPDGYGGGDPAITNFSTYLAKWTSFADTITNYVPNAKFGGPDGAGAAWTGPFANAETGSGIVTSIISHQYVGGNSGSLTVTQIVAGMLSQKWDTNNYPNQYNATEAVALAGGFPYRQTEFNSYVAPYPGTWGGNNSFASALFALDGAHWWAAHGCAGVNFHTFLGKYNATIYYDADGNYQFFPIGYGMKAFDVGGHGAVMPPTITNSNNLNLTAYAVLDDTNLYVTILDRENGTNARDAAVTIAPSGLLSRSAAVMFLVTTNGGVYATNDITLGGAYITNNAPWLGQWTALSPLTNGQCTVTVPASSAAIVKITGTWFIPPVITRDLPAQVLLPSGKSYRYSITVKGGLPMNYQWYQGPSPISGATNGSYLSASGAVGSTNSYSVVITNIYGAVTSAVSALTVVPPLTDSYARQILGCGPAAYWPLQETNSPAPATTETNYGTLGALGNAYYASTNATDVLFGRPGALAGTTDTAVTFNGAGEPSGNADSFAFVPRVTPALTLRPPFSLEAWINSATPPSSASGGVNTQDFLGEGGSGFDSPANGGILAGIRVAWIYVNQTNLPNGPGFSILTYNTNGSLVYYQIPVAAGNQWYHCVVTYDGTNAIMYLNGSMAFSTNFTMGVDTWSPLTIGAGRWQGYAPTRGLVGSEDEVAIYTNVLSGMAIGNHYRAGVSTGSNYMQTVLNDRPLLYYRMDNPSWISPNPLISPVAVNYGSAPVNGTYLPGIVPGGLSGPAISAIGTNSMAAPINGIISCVDGGNDPSFNPTNLQPFTAMAWFRTYPSDGRIQSIMSHGGISSWSLNLVGTNGLLSWNSGAGLVNSVKPLNDGNWHFAAGVYDGANNYLYVDGALNNSVAASGHVVGDTNDDILIGGDPDFARVGSNERYFAGAIAQAAFFTNALSAIQVQGIYNAALMASVNTSPTNILFSSSAGQLTLSWPADHIGWELQSNSLGLTATSAWFTIAGSTTTNQMIFMPDPARTNVFYRLLYQP